MANHSSSSRTSERKTAPQTASKASETFSVLVVDDHDIVRTGLKLVLAESPLLRVVGEAGSVAAALAECRRKCPDVVLLDLRLPDASGVEACREMKLQFPGIRVLFLTSYGDEANILAGLAAGADGYLLKSITGNDITDAVLKVAQGGAVLDPLVTRQILGHVSQQAASRRQEKDSALSELTGKEKQMLKAISVGKLNKEIADELGISEKTVRNQLTQIYSRIGVKTRTEAAVYYERSQHGHIGNITNS